ncbi:hypothetical protein [Candidatus Gromoviella agglomerans]|uniref:hypothetical protein n=1 Tax=Candidatus Gromoviella agglomerans TaxID=2806609 RepID=UPI001E5C3C6A|nr:hypothetical protein [Candidatus Gromoviella agglomerans]UFX98616.1 hypothetical protein Gromo_00537 [Candidatus Gromoviella agglomerans]
MKSYSRQKFLQDIHKVFSESLTSGQLNISLKALELISKYVDQDTCIEFEDISIEDLDQIIDSIQRAIDKLQIKNTKQTHETELK